jgi:hypothetical protein
LAHREHAYQRLIEPGQSHAPVVTLVLTAGAMLSLASAVSFAVPTLAWLGPPLAVAVFAVEWRQAGRRRPAA